MFSPQPSVDALGLYGDGSTVPAKFMFAQEWHPDWTTGGSFQDQQSLPVDNPPSSSRKVSQSSARKRAPKAPTMSANSWKPCESRIQQLYVQEGKSLEELRETVNKEFGITANERQYKVQIQRMNLKRNGKADERKKVVRHIQHRVNKVGKKSSLVRVRGHKIKEEKLSRWIKEEAKNQPSMSPNPLPPLPSYISIYTNSPPGSPKPMPYFLWDHQLPGSGSMAFGDTQSPVIQRLLKYVRGPTRMIEAQESRAIFNDFENILCSNDITDEKFRCDAWNLIVEKNIIQIRNLMLTQRLTVNREWEGAPKLKSPPTVRGRHRAASRMTRYGRLDTSFWTATESVGVNGANEDTIASTDSAFAGRVAILPHYSKSCPFGVVLEFTPYLDPKPKITYQAMIPNDSKIFRLIEFGQVEEFIKAFEQGTASLTDRDEQGRSLLNYAFFHSNVDICKFLVDRDADVNEFGFTRSGNFGPIHSSSKSLDIEIEEEERHKKSCCMKILLEAGADTSLEAHSHKHILFSTFMNALFVNSITTFKYILDLGEPFISPNVNYKDVRGYECSPLITLARSCAYSLVGIIHIVEKAILLLQRKADILCRDYNGDTVLHAVLKCKRLGEGDERRRYLKHVGQSWKWCAALQASKDLLMVFITAGANLYATNDEGKTPSMVASDSHRDNEWIEVLTACGFDANEVLAQSDPEIYGCTREYQMSKLSFEEYCRQRPEQSPEYWQKYWQEHHRLEEVGTDDEDEDGDAGRGFNEDEHSKIYDKRRDIVPENMGNIEINCIDLLDLNMNDFFVEDYQVGDHDEGKEIVSDFDSEDIDNSKGNGINSMDPNMAGSFDDITGSTDELWTTWLNWEKHVDGAL